MRVVHARRVLAREHVGVDGLAEHLELAEDAREHVAPQVLPVEVVLQQPEQLDLGTLRARARARVSVRTRVRVRIQG